MAMWVGAGLAAALLLAPGFASGVDLGSCVPVRWPGGPLEVARRAAVKPLQPELASALQRWYLPWSLDLLRGTSVNCLLVTWSAGETTAEQEQRRILRDYAAEAHRRGMAVIALVASPQDAIRIGKLASHDGLDGATHLDASPAAISPGVRIFSKNGAVQATPSSEPWIDSNLWLVRSLRAHTKEPVWLDYTLDDPSETGYVRAISDAAAANGHWVVAPHDELLMGLAAGAPEATSCWRRVMATLRFFEDHREWRMYLPSGPLGIVQPDNPSAPENLNLITRRRIPYELLDRAALSEPALRNLQAALTVGIPLTKEEKTVLRQFAESGGLSIVGPSWGDPVPNAKSYLEKPCGKGRIVVYREEEPDSESLSKDVLYLMGKDNLGLRLFHASSVLPQVSTSADGRQFLIAIVNYATEPAEAIVLRLTGQYRSARFYSLDDPPISLNLEQSERGIQLTLPKVPVYAAVVLER